MAVERLTKKIVEAAPVTGAEYVVWDTTLSGFGLKVTKQGAKSYIFRYRMGGRGFPERRVTIGHPRKGMKVDDARGEAQQLAAMVRRGDDPRVQIERMKVDAFGEYAEMFIATYLPENWPKWQGEGARLLRREVIPHFGPTPLAAITKRDVTALFDRLAPRVGIARNVSTVLRRLFNWAVERGELERSPMDKIRLPKKPSVADRHLDDVEIAALWSATQAIDHAYAGVVRTLLLTGQRRDEVADMVWDEVDLEKALWRLPGGLRTKNGQPHDVPLADAVVEQLAAFKTTGSEYVFSPTGEGPITNWGYWKKRLDDEFQRVMVERGHLPPEHWKVHDLRRTVGTGMQRIGIDGDVVEAFHNRQVREGVAGRYQHHDYPVEKREAAEKWADHVVSLATMPAI